MKKLNIKKKGAKMKAKYEVGEYIRTKAGHFHKITEIDENGLIYFEDSSEGWSREQFDNIAKKHSKNIIDLIEVGDFVNGYNVIAKNTNELFVFYTIYGKYTDEQYKLRIQSDDIESILSILTHEQYENDCYRLEEEE